MLARNTLINLVGQGVPVLVALVAIPILIDRLGTDRFGVLSIAIVTIGYFGFFDLGFGRAMTQIVAERLGRGDEEEISPIAWTGLLLMIVFGIVGATVLFLLAPLLTERVLQIPEALQQESLVGFELLALSLPFVISTAALRGILEANQRFDLVNLIRLPMGVFTFLGPLAVLPFSNRLGPVISVLVAGRILAWAAHIFYCLRAVPILRKFEVRARGTIGPLTRVGGWLTVSNLISPLMVTADRFLIGAVLSMTAVTYYVTPYELVTKLWIITAALLGVLYPAFAASFAVSPKRTASLYDQGMRLTFVIFFQLAFTFVLLAPFGLELWLGPEFAENSTAILQWLSVGIFINAVAQVAYTVIQGIGRADITGKLHLLELPIYIGLLYWSMLSFGVMGAAIAWTARVSLDAVLLIAIAARMVPGGSMISLRIGGMLTGGLAVLAMASLVGGLGPSIAVLLVGSLLFTFFAWRVVLTAEERTRLRSLMRSGSAIESSGGATSEQGSASATKSLTS